MKNHKYEIGDWVSVSATVRFHIERVSGTRRKEMINTPCDPFVAKVVGATHKQIGHYERDSDDFIPDVRGTYFVMENTIFLWLVRRGLMNKPIYVLPEYLKAIEYNYEFPNMWRSPVVHTDETKEARRQAAREMFRDSSGRFLTS